MKKSIIILSAISLVAFTSCDNKKADEVTATEETTTDDMDRIDEVNRTDVNVESNDTDTEVVATEGTPDFDNAALQDYMNSYDEYMNDYKEAMETQDMAKMQALGAKGEELAEKAQSFTSLSDADAKKLGEYMEAKAKEMQEIAMKAAGQ